MIQTIGRAILTVALAYAALELAACTLGQPKQAAEVVKPPMIYANMPLDKALKAGIDFGGDTLQDVRKLIRRRHEGAKAAPALREAILADLETSADN